MTFQDDEPNNANPHALETIVRAGEKRSIVASEDIFDERGTKLLARGQPISASLQQRLLERKLKQPLESNLEVADGVSPKELKAALEAFVSTDHPLAHAIKPWFTGLATEVAHIKVHSVVRLLLTAAQTVRPGVYDHAVRGMGLAGAMWLKGGGDRGQLQTVLLGGLLHDIGEMYVNPSYLDTKEPLDTAGYRNVAVHPRLGAMVLGRMADYPQPLVNAVAQHHERLDGTGYPGRLVGSAVSPLGRLLAVVEVTLGITSSSKFPWAHTSFALRMIPGEFEGSGLGFVTAAAREAAEDLSLAGEASPSKLDIVNDQLAAALAVAMETQRNASTSEVRAVAERAHQLLSRLRIGWNEMGLWSQDSKEEVSRETSFEMRMAERELAYRMRFIRRECLWTEKELSEAENQALLPVWDSLEVAGSSTVQQ
ncbi:MAG: HD domain-containing phosphohydrolase [Pseudomonadota bacterium]